MVGLNRLICGLDCGRLALDDGGLLCCEAAVSVVLLNSFSVKRYCLTEGKCLVMLYNTPLAPEIADFLSVWLTTRHSSFSRTYPPDEWFGAPFEGCSDA
jgi:hypothetical protein